MRRQPPLEPRSSQRCLPPRGRKAISDDHGETMSIRITVNGEEILREHL